MPLQYKEDLELEETSSFLVGNADGIQCYNRKKDDEDEENFSFLMPRQRRAFTQFNRNHGQRVLVSVAIVLTIIMCAIYLSGMMSSSNGSDIQSTVRMKTTSSSLLATSELKTNSSCTWAQIIPKNVLRLSEIFNVGWAKKMKAIYQKFLVFSCLAIQR